VHEDLNMTPAPIVTVWTPTQGTFAGREAGYRQVVIERMREVWARRAAIERIAAQYRLQTLDIAPVVPHQGGYVAVESVLIELFAEPFDHLGLMHGGGVREIEAAVEEITGWRAELKGRGTYFQVDLDENQLRPVVAASTIG
jgi:hypothetical protein